MCRVEQSRPEFGRWGMKSKGGDKGYAKKKRKKKKKMKMNRSQEAAGED